MWFDRKTTPIFSVQLQRAFLDCQLTNFPFWHCSVILGTNHKVLWSRLVNLVKGRGLSFRWTAREVAVNWSGLLVEGGFDCRKQQIPSLFVCSRYIWCCRADLRMKGVSQMKRSCCFQLQIFDNMLTFRSNKVIYTTCSTVTKLPTS